MAGHFYAFMTILNISRLTSRGNYILWRHAYDAYLIGNVQVLHDHGVWTDESEVQFTSFQLMKILSLFLVLIECTPVILKLVTVTQLSLLTSVSKYFLHSCQSHCIRVNTKTEANNLRVPCSDKKKIPCGCFSNNKYGNENECLNDKMNR